LGAQKAGKRRCALEGQTPDPPKLRKNIVKKRGGGGFALLPDMERGTKEKANVELSVWILSTKEIWVKRQGST